MLHMLSLSLLALLPLTSSVWAVPTCSVQSSSSASAADASTTASSQSASGSLGNNDNKIAMSWYTGWHTNHLSPANVSWDKYTAVTYAFAVTTDDVNNVSLALSSGPLLPVFVTEAHKHNVKALLTIGGWTGSRYFSTAVGSPENRTAFVENMISLVKKYDLDGLDFDWEYPNRQGLGCNIVSPQDSENLLAFLQELRKNSVMQNLTISAAATIKLFLGADGNPMTDVSGFASVLDYLAIMNYDVWGSWSKSVGPNAPLNDTCASGDEQQGSAVSALKAWTDAGFPANKLLLGVGSYGHSFFVSNSSALASSNSSSSSAGTSVPPGTLPLAPYPPFDATQQPKGDSWDVVAADEKDPCGVPLSISGNWNFRGLIDEGLLDHNGTATPGTGFRFDQCSQTPYVYDTKTQAMISYDDVQSFAAKGKFIVDSGMAGFAMWEAAGDHNDLLLDSINAAMGK
ncbi:unnamed protein product [Somion occarium]|uniref:GH18 domain-containing protein n=1 Tax=Somion occarium TaxID=3059160 RepID=A0ABP1DM16_9APHY